jgi:branched-chain amino acid aminotransferase
MEMDIYYIDGQFVPSNEATISVNDLALLRGYGVFDFLRTYNKTPFFLDDHLDRLRRSADLIDISLPWSNRELQNIVQETLDRNGHPESSIKIVVTGGDSHDGLIPIGKSRLLVMVSALKPLDPAEYESGVKLTTSRIPRLFPGAKSTNYIAGIRAIAAARKAGAAESLYVGRNNQILECVTSNFFGFREGKMVTPESDILPGITRKVVLDLAADLFAVETREMDLDELTLLDEAFITSSTREVLPVVRVDDTTVGNGRPGENTRRLMALFSEFTATYGRHSQ